MDVSIKQVSSRKQLKEFIFLPAYVHRDHPQWVPPVWMDEKAFFNPAKNKSFAHCDTTMLLAYKNNKVVGRIMGIIHHGYNRQKSDKTGRFGFMECYNDPEVAGVLLASVEKWAMDKGMNRMIGPYGFSDKDPQGFQTEGFEYTGLIATNCNFPYMNDLVIANGYVKEIDCLAFMMPVPDKFPESHQRIYERTLRNEHLKVIEFSRKKELYPWIDGILTLMNECYRDIYGFIPLDEDEKKAFASRYLPVIDARFVKLIKYGNELVGFFIALPSLAKGLQKSGGFLLPIGWYHILREMKRTTQLDLMLGGVKPDYQGLGWEVLMGFAMLESARIAGFRQIEVHLILETNYKMLAEVQKLNAMPHKRFRVYGKSLT